MTIPAAMTASLKLFLFTSILSILLFTACKQTGQNTDVSNTTISDSVAIWIEGARDETKLLQRRKELLSKAYSTTQNLDSDSLKTKYLSRLSVRYLNMNDSLAFRKVNREVMDAARTIKDSVSLAEAHWDVAMLFDRSSVADSAFFHFREAQKIYDKIKDKYSSGRMLYNMAKVQANIRDYTGSEVTGIQALELLKPFNNHNRLYNCYNHLGVVANALGEYERALEYHQEALNQLQQIPNKGTRIYTNANNIGSVYKEQGLYEKALQQFNFIINADSIDIKTPKTYVLALNNMADCKLKLKDTIGIKVQLEKALKLGEKLENFRTMSVSNYRMAEYKLLRADTVSALTYANEAESYAKRTSNNKRLLKTLQLKARLEPAKAVGYTQQYVALNDSLQQIERQERNKFARIRFETNEQIAENLLLAKQRQLWIGIALALLVIAIAVFVIITQRVKNQKLKFEQEQQATNQEISNLLIAQSGKMAEVKKAEQKRISEELHDGVLGQMLGIRLILSSLNKKNDDEAVTKRAELISQLQGVESEIRTISHELSDAAYKKIHNFTFSIEELLTRISESSGIEYTFTYDDGVAWDALPTETKINLYRIIQESLQNTVKHAKCQNVAVDFKKVAENIEIYIADDGKGFNVRKGKKGIGLKNITSRVDKINATFNIDSTLGKGTTVILKVPFNDAA